MILLVLAVFCVISEATFLPVTGWITTGAVTIGALIATIIGNTVRENRIKAFEELMSSEMIIENYGMQYDYAYQKYIGVPLWAVFVICGIIIGVFTDILIRKTRPKN